jgi:uncharacterized protein
VQDVETRHRREGPNAMTNGSGNIPDPPVSDQIELVPRLITGGEGSVSFGEISPLRPWGPWATVGWTLLSLVVLFGVQFAVLVIFMLVQLSVGSDAKLEELSYNGNFLAACTFASTPAIIGLVTLLIWGRGCRIREYLALNVPDARSGFISAAGLGLVLVATDLTSYFLGRPLVPKVMVDFYRTSWLPLLVFAVVVLAPLGEETLFRGFLYKGIESSRAGPVMAIVVSTLIFALIHLQYDWYGVLGVAAIGLYLGIVRYGSSSLLLTMLLHAIANLVATAEVFIVWQ